MIELFAMTILITIINYIGIALGFILGQNKDNKEKVTSFVMSNILGHKEDLEEAFVPDED